MGFDIVLEPGGQSYSCENAGGGYSDVDAAHTQPGQCERTSNDYDDYVQPVQRICLSLDAKSGFKAKCSMAYIQRILFTDTSNELFARPQDGCHTYPGEDIATDDIARPVDSKINPGGAACQYCHTQKPCGRDL